MKNIAAMVRTIKVTIFALLAVVLGLVGFLYLAPEQATRLALDAERSHAGLTRKEITLPDGLRYVYLEGGSGETLILLHGFGADKDNFTRVARWLTPHYRVIAPDLPGFGESSHPADADYGPAVQAERMHQLALALVRLHQRRLAGRAIAGDGGLRRQVLDALPFRLTACQERALGEIGRDMAEERRMLRLLQGDGHATILNRAGRL